jgi:thiol-disulfide isomerase/thioredoxin
MLEGIKNAIKTIPQNRNIMLILFLTLLFIGLAVYVYIYYIRNRINPTYVENKELVQQPDNEAELFYFYTNWCPYCKKAKPEWEKLKSEYENKSINGTTIYFREIDCEKDEKTPEQYKVEAYPTIKLITNGKVIEYDAKPNYETLNEFLNTSL